MKLSDLLPGVPEAEAPKVAAPEIPTLDPAALSEAVERFMPQLGALAALFERGVIALEAIAAANERAAEQLTKEEPPKEEPQKEEPPSVVVDMAPVVQLVAPQADAASEG